MVKRKQKQNGLTPSQEIAFRSFAAGANIFLTGKGGTGKSFTVEYIKKWCQSKGISYIVCAPSGIAAHNIGGSTIHRVFKIKPEIIDPLKKRMQLDKNVRKVLDKAQVIIIDEISMVRADVFRYIANTILDVWEHKPREARKQLLVVGDFYQIPPVLPDDEREAYQFWYKEELYAFQTAQWQQLQLQSIELQENMRQTDAEYMRVLDAIREGSATSDDLNLFRSDEPDPTAITICGTNKVAQSINDTNLKILYKQKKKKRSFKAEEEGKVEPSAYRGIDQVLSLVVGARVIMTSNDADHRWVNGTFGTITGLDDDAVTVFLDNGTTASVERYKWEFYEYVVSPGRNGKEAELECRLVGSVKQFPMRLGWAISIHKSQGQTYERVNVDVRNIFSDGQLYVALSRCKSLSGMRIIGQVTPEKVMVNEDVRRFMANAHKEPELTGQMLPFADSDGHSGDPDRYQEGWDDGYKEGYDDGDADAQARYEEMKAQDLSVRQLSTYTTREREKALLSPEERNPKGAGRKPRNPEGKQQSKAIRVPESVAGVLKQLGDIAKDHPEIADRLQEFAEKIEKEYTGTGKRRTNRQAGQTATPPPYSV